MARCFACARRHLAGRAAESLTITASTVWLGNGASLTSSYTGLRFTNLSIPQGATITSAKLQVYSSQFQSLAIAMSITAEAIGNSPTFSATNLPSQRTLTSHQVSHSSNTAWGVKTWYTLDEMASVVQEVVNRGDWQSGNSLSIILKGTGSANARKFVRSWDNDSTHAAELVITYTTGSGTSATAITYQYDALSRLTSATYSTGAVYTYTYDAVGNRLSDGAPTGVTTYTYDIANRLNMINGTINYVWDNNGNLVNNGQNVTYTYDSANRLIAINTSLYTFGYNGLGDRVKQLANGTPITYTLDLAGGLTQVLAETATTATTTYLYGSARLAQQTASATDYFLPDALGSVRQLANASGNVTLLKSYDPYGQPVSSSGSDSSNYDFAGEYKDTSALFYLRARYYSSKPGRFIQKDSWPGSYINLADAGGSYDGSGTGQVGTGDWFVDYTRPQSLNGWSYANGNPINLTDPSGHQSVSAPSSGLPQLCPFNVGGFTLWLPCVLLPPPSPTPPPNPQPWPFPPADNWWSRTCQSQQQQKDQNNKYCQAALDKIRAALSVVKGRYNDWVVDRLGRRDPGHRKSYAQAQQRLQNALDDWDKHNCGPLPEDVADARDWVGKPLPES